MSAWLASLLTSLVTKLVGYYTRMMLWFEARRQREEAERKRVDDVIKAIDELMRRPPPASEAERVEREKELDELQKDLF
jgi:hypothetical protein